MQSEQSERSAKELYNEGQRLHLNGRDYLRAIEYYNQAIRLNPNFGNAYLDRGFARIQLKEYREAIKDFTRAMELELEYPDTNFPEAYYGRGVAYAGIGDYQKAIDNFNQAINLDSAAEFEGTRSVDFTGGEQDLKFRLATAYYSRGIAKAQKDRPGAIRDLQRSAKLFSDLGARSDYQKVQNFLKKLS
ncbi:tetratricopeptide repeat protein [Crinalium epipsammum]|nr:tetratricopeptide repeat protein [Crinalium epipsammum]